MCAVCIPSVTVIGNTMKFSFPNRCVRSTPSPSVKNMDLVIPGPREDCNEMSDEELRQLLASLKITRRERRAIKRKLAEIRGEKQSKTYKVLEVAACVASVLFFIPSFAYAAPSFSVERAFSPLIELIRDIANPICYVMFIIGFIYVMIGRAHEGFRRMQYAAFGYIGVQLAPGLMKIIKQVGSSMAL